MSVDDVLYLSSLDSERFEPVRMCRILRSVQFDTGKDALLVRLDPGVHGSDFGQSADILEFVLTTRFEGASIAPIDEFPCFVFIAIPKSGWNSDSHVVRSADLEIVGWGELYRSEADAASNSFD